MTSKTKLVPLSNGKAFAVVDAEDFDRVMTKHWCVFSRSNGRRYGAERVQADDYGDLFRIELPNDEPVVLVRLLNSTPEPSGERKVYLLRVPPTVTSAREAVSWSFGMEKPEEYAPAVET